MTDFIGTDTATATGNNNITGTSKADDIYGGSGVDTINSGNGNDIVDGGTGNDIIDGGAGIDVIYGNLGDDQLIGGNGADIIYGGAGNDSIGGVLASSDDGSENGGDIIYGDGYNGLTQVGVTNLKLGTSADALGATPVNDTTTVYSSTNNATITITNGAFATTLGNDLINGGNGNDTIYGDNGWDVSGLGSYANTTGAGNDIIHAGTGNDSVYGEVGDDQLYGENGNDKLYGGSGNDRIDGGNGDDIIDGGTGNDILIGGLGADILTGGTGNDSFVFNASTDSSDSNLDEGNVTEFFHELAEHVREHEHEDDHDQIGIDVITDFTASNDTSSANGLDKIDLSALLGTTDLNWGGQIPTANGVWFQHGPDGNTYVMADVNGNTATAELLIRLDGIHNLSNNDFLGLRNAAVVIDTSDTTGAATEIADHAAGENTATHTAIGTLNFTDTDFNSVHTASVVPQSNGYLGNFVLGTVNDVNTSVGWTFTVNDGALDYLAAGQTLLQTYTIAVADGAGSSALQTVTVTLTGTNDAPVITNTSATLLGAVQEDTTLSISGQLSASDVDTGATQTWSVQNSAAGTYGAIAVDSNGKWTYSLANGAVNAQALAQGEHHDETFTLRVTDDKGAFVDQTVTVTINGTNDAAVLSSAVASLTETNAVLNTSGTLTITDVDSAATFVAQTNTAGTYGAFTIGTNGAWSYVASSAHNEFVAGTTYTDTFTVSSADGTSTSVVVNIAGINDAAVLSSSVASLTETNVVLNTSGTLTISDVDSAAAFVAQTDVSGTYGTFAIDTAGAWTYTASSAHDEFVAGTTYTDTFNVSSADGTNTSVTVNIEGTNDAAVLSSAVEYLAETDAVLTTSGTLTITDIDSAATFVAQTDVSGIYGTFNLSTDGAWTYATYSAYNELAVGATYTDTFTVASADGTTSNVTVNIAGTNDAAVITGTSTASFNETNAVLNASGQLTATDVDSTATFVAQTAAAGTNGYGSFSIGTNGAWTYATNNAHNEFVAGTTYTDSLTVATADGTTQLLTVSILGSNDAAVITGTSTASLTETNAVLNASGQLTATDVDSSAAFVAQTNAAGSNGYGSFSIASNGAWTYATTTAHDEFVAGTTYTDSLTVATADGTTQLLTLSILGTADTVTGNDNVITNTALGTLFNIPNWTLLANDTLSPSSITNVSVGTGGTTSTATAGFISFTDSSPANGSFTYQAVSSLGAGSLGTVNVTSVTGTSITGTSGNDIIIGATSNDTIVGFVGADMVDGGAGTDTLTLSGTSADLNAATDAQLVNVEAITASAAATITLSNQTEAFTITGSNGADTITGGSDNDTIVGFVGADTVDGGAGTDTLQLRLIGTSATLNAATDAQLVNVEAIATSAAATINLSKQTDGFVVAGSAGIDTITGSTGNDTISGGAGNDVITGGAGNDTFTGGTGNDTFNVDLGTDTITDLSGSDNLVVSWGATANATVTAAFIATAATINNSTASLISAGFGINMALATGTTGYKITNTGGGATLVGSINDDTLTGGVAADTLTGGAGSDRFIINGGSSLATLGASGDAGTVSGYDVITDFNTAVDLLNLQGASIGPSTFASVGSNDSALTISGAKVMSHNLVNGLITFDDTDTFTTALSLTSTTNVAAAVDYLQKNDLGDAGATVAFTATINSVAHTYIYEQVGATQNTANDILVDLTGVTISDLGALKGVITGYDNVITNVALGTSFNIPILALLANDTNSPTSINNVSAGIGGTTSTATTGFVTFNDTSPANGSFTYQAVSGGVAGTVGTVLITSSTVPVTTITGYVVNNGFLGTAGDDIMIGSAGVDTLYGGLGADYMTGGAGNDLFYSNLSCSPGIIGGSGDAGTVSGYDVITGFTVGDTFWPGLNTPTTLVNSVGTNGTDSTLTIAGQTVKSHAVTNGIITFSSSDTYSSATKFTLSSTAAVAAVVQYMHNQAFITAVNAANHLGTVMAFVANIGGVAHTYAFDQVADVANATNDVLVDFLGVTATNITAINYGPAGVAGSAINLGLSGLAMNQIDATSLSITVLGVPKGWTLSEGSDNGDGSWTVLTSNPSALSITSPDNYTGALALKVSENWLNADGTMGMAYGTDNVEAYKQSAPVFAWSGDDYLTGSSANDVMVFGKPIGNDTVYNFDTTADKIDLIGFAGFNSFADVQSHLSVDAQGNALLSLANGQSITFNGIIAAALTASDFVFNEVPVTHNPGSMVISDGAMLPLGGIVDNTGLIALQSNGGATQLELVGGGVTLQGHGQVTLTDNGSNIIFGATPETTLTNIDNTISGSGQLGGGSLSLDNQGIIVAVGTQTLTIDTGAHAVINSGTLESTGTGGLIINSAVSNSGLLWAHGGNLTVNNTVSGGSVLIDGAGNIEFGGATSANISFGAAASGLVNTLKLDNAALFTCSVTGLNADDVVDLVNINSYTASMSYAANAANTGGTLSVSDGGTAVTLTLIGQYANDGFHLAADATGGSAVSYY